MQMNIRPCQIPRLQEQKYAGEAANGEASQAEAPWPCCLFRQALVPARAAVLGPTLKRMAKRAGHQCKKECTDTFGIAIHKTIVQVKRLMGQLLQQEHYGLAAYVGKRWGLPVQLVWEQWARSLIL